jgi:Fe-S-cluster containining protein
LKLESANTVHASNTSPNSGTPTPERYRCVRCGNCCRWPGYVRLTAEDIDRISAYLQVPPEEFANRYTELTSQRDSLTLIEKPDRSCIFLTESNLCQIHPVKPQQCRDFPNRWNFPGWQRQCNAADTQDPPSAKNSP